MRAAFFLGCAGSIISGSALAGKFGGGKVVRFGAIWWLIFVSITFCAANLSVMIAIRALLKLGGEVSFPGMTSA